MSEDFTFEPSEFKVLEEIVHDETIQRPETIRFYTLEEQVGDAYDKMIPKGRTTKFQMEVLRKEADRLRQLYQDHIVPTAETYLRSMESTSTGSIPCMRVRIYPNLTIRRNGFLSTKKPVCASQTSIVP